MGSCSAQGSPGCLALLRALVADLWPNHARPCGSFALMSCRAGHTNSCPVSSARLGSPSGEAHAAPDSPTPITGFSTQAREGNLVLGFISGVLESDRAGALTFHIPARDLGSW